ncbi:hypothetical protein QE152_g32705 [Popillia japonica]|uniref:Uncharacterized protein n=1 Tax=Popillia japonica TaxID=7064 RepID=A0AAW1IXX2_POPJA
MKDDRPKPHTLSYSEMVKDVVVVKPKAKQNNAVTKEEICKNVKPASLEVGIINQKQSKIMLSRKKKYAKTSAGFDHVKDCTSAMKYLKCATEDQTVDVSDSETMSHNRGGL